MKKYIIPATESMLVSSDAMMVQVASGTLEGTGNAGDNINYAD